MLDVSSWIMTLLPIDVEDPAFYPLFCSHAIGLVGLVDSFITGDSEIMFGSTLVIVGLSAIGSRKVARDPRASSLVLKANFLTTAFYVQHLFCEEYNVITKSIMSALSMVILFKHLKVYLKLPSESALLELLTDLYAESRERRMKRTCPAVTQHAISMRISVKEKMLRIAACNDLHPHKSEGVHHGSNTETNELLHNFSQNSKYQLNNFLDETADETPLEEVTEEEDEYCDTSEKYSEQNTCCLTDDIDF